MVGRYIVDGEQVDSLDLKMLALTQGVAVAEEVYERFSRSYRISADPYQCNGIFLPDGTVVHVADIGAGAGFRLEAGGSGGGSGVRLMRGGECVTEVGLPGASDFYEQTTSRGKAKWTGKQRHVDTLRHIAREHGKHKCGCTFVLGLEPVESFLAGAEELAREGVVPLASVLMGHGLPGIAGAERLDLGFFRAAKRGLARIYEEYGGEPAGAGSHVSVARDVWRWRVELLG